ncbi:hypothetical protein HYT91_01560 [Candidatus Pacearchaeota archaeon]|nr:hypothetical protein [Candidatus Pacearchaeota archaeon]
MIIFLKNKKGWTSVIEVFVSILLIAGILAVVVNSNAIQKPKLSEQIYKDQALTLKIIQMDDEMRTSVLNEQLSQGINDTIKNTMPDYLDCKSKICDFPNEECDLETLPEKEIFVKSILITTDGSEYKAKELKLWCWER